MERTQAEEIRARREHMRVLTGKRPARRRRARLPKQKQPDHIKLAYYGSLRTRILQPAKALVDARLVPQLQAIVGARGDSERTDAGGSKRVNEVMAQIGDRFFSNVRSSDMEEIAQRYAGSTSDLQRAELGRQLRAAVGVEVPFNDATLGPQIEHFTATNVSLIKTIPQRYFSQVENKVLEGIGAGARWEQIAEDLEERYRVSEAVARVIARDQVGKFYADLNESRQTNLGITHFYWMTGADERVCPICAPLNGKRFAWARPPAEGLPGSVHPQCGCSADPDTDQLVEDLED